MGILNNERLSYLSRNLSNTINNASNVKVSNSSHGNKLDTVMDSLVEKADDITKATTQEVVNTTSMFRVGTGNVDVSSDVEDGFSNIGLQGNTLVNVVKTYDNSKFKFTNASKLSDGYFKIQYGANVNSSNVIPKVGTHMYKPSTTYTVVVDIKENTCGKNLGISLIYSGVESFSTRDFSNLTGISTLTIKTRSDLNISDKGTVPTYDLYFGIWKEDGGDLSKHITFRYWILEGDWTNKEIPPYFEGMKSVGDLQEDGKHKIEILSTGKNLFDIPNHSVGQTGEIFTGSLKPFTNYILSFRKKRIGNYTNPQFHCLWSENFLLTNNDFSSTSQVTWLNGSDLGIKRLTIMDSSVECIGIFNSGNNNKFKINFANNNGDSNKNIEVLNIQLEISSKNTSYEPYKSNKTQILLDEPLRKINDDIYDELLDDGTLIRRCGEIIISGKESIGIINNDISISTIRFRISNQGLPLKIFSPPVSDKFITGNDATMNAKDNEQIFTHSVNNVFDIRILASKLESPNIQGFKQWLSKNPVTVVYELETPIVTKLNPTQLRLFKEGHLSINSTITPTSTHTVLLNKSAQIENSIIQSQSLNSRVDELEGLYDNMILETSYKLANLDFDFSLVKGGE